MWLVNYSEYNLAVFNRRYRYNYVTPTSYLELLTTFLKLLSEKRAETTAQKRRLEGGLGKLTSTAEQVGGAGLSPKATLLELV